jgi:predicted RNA-binding protein associated with RNAse of E/G family
MDAQELKDIDELARAIQREQAKGVTRDSRVMRVVNAVPGLVAALREQKRENERLLDESPKETR